MNLLQEGILADTWWYALTSRLTDENFKRLADLRSSQAFSAVQIVVGIPPETTPNDPNAASPYGPAWYANGNFNKKYLNYARERIIYLNQRGLTAIVYGAWGPQVNWLGLDRMIEWWKEVITTTGDLQVIYCLTGESNLNCGFYDCSSPLFSLVLNSKNTRKIEQFIIQTLNRILNVQIGKKNRIRAWSKVLENIAQMTNRPILIHPTIFELGFECVINQHLLAANTTQTGHIEESRPYLHRLPLAHQANKDPIGREFINLEPWYEGILDKFFVEDQLYAFWTSILAGSIGFCYGAQGIWNAGDGIFLNHWGNQTFSQAINLDTPRLLGLSYAIIKPYLKQKSTCQMIEAGDRLLKIQRSFDNTTFTFVPEMQEAYQPPTGRIWLPLEGRYVSKLPSEGQVVIISQ